MAAVKNNLRANAFPQTTDDSSAGYSIGSLWFYGQLRFQCTSATVSAATWALRGGAGLLKLDSGTLASAATLDVVLSQYSALGIAGFQLKVRNFIPATDGASLWARLSGDGGVSYDAAAGNYKYAQTVSYSTGTGEWSGIVSDADVKMVLGEAITNNAVGGLTADIEMQDNFNSATQARLKWSGVMTTSGFAGAHVHGGGHRIAGGAKNAVRLLFSSGNIASGKWALYGYI